MDDIWFPEEKNENHPEPVSEKTEDIEPGNQIPDAVLGFRVWRIHEAGLGAAAHANLFWTPGVNIAACGKHSPEEVPASKCGCGFNSFYALPEEELVCRTTAIFIWGAVVHAGKAEMHSDSLRSSEAQILAFYLPREEVAIRDMGAIERSIARYGAPVFRDRNKFLEYVGQYGKQINKTPVDKRRIEKVIMAGTSIFYPKRRKTSMNRALRISLLVLWALAILALSGAIIWHSRDISMVKWFFLVLITPVLFALLYGLHSFIAPETVYTHKVKSYESSIVAGVLLVAMFVSFGFLAISVSSFTTAEEQGVKTIERISDYRFGEAKAFLESNQDLSNDLDDAGLETVFKKDLIRLFAPGDVSMNSRWIQASFGPQGVNNIACSENWNDCPGLDTKKETSEAKVKQEIKYHELEVQRLKRELAERESERKQKDLPFLGF